MEEPIVEETKLVRGKRKTTEPAAPIATKKATGNKKAKAAVEETEEEALVLICDGCEGEFFYDELYPKGDFEVPEVSS